jgi:alpha-beta hydrolase superfamily lysophospholipase
MKDIIIAVAASCGVAVASCGVAAAATAAATTAGAEPVESPIEAPGPSGPLKGTLLTPDGGHGPVVLIIPGSGPTDRDGNSPAGVLAAPYRLLAEGLAAHGVTSVRIDKRGMFGSAAATTDANAVTIPDYVMDVQAWTRVVRARTKGSCIWLLGHSEGGLIAMAAAKNPDLCGLLLVSAPGRPMGEIIREQLKANPANAPVLSQALPALDALEAGKRVDTANMNPALLPLFRPTVQGFLISAFSYDPAKLLAGYGKPVLILQGQRDLQIREADAQALKVADPKAKLVLLPDVNHVLKSVASDDMRANLATYGNSSLPLAPGVVESISDFLTSHGAGGGK